MPMQKLQRTIYTARVHTTGGRENGASRSEDGKLDVQLSPPGTTGAGTNPEQLFAAGYSACFIGALKFVAGQKKIALPADTSIDADVGIGQIPEGFGIKVAMAVKIPGMERAKAEELVQAAHAVCPYSNATRGNIDVDLKVV